MYQVIDDDIKPCTGGSNGSAYLLYRGGMDNNKAALPFNHKGNKKAYLDKTDGRDVLLQMTFHRVFIKRKQAAVDN